MTGLSDVMPLRKVGSRVLLLSAVVAGIVFGAANACAPTVVVGALVCPDAPADATPTPDPDASVPLPWSTGFEDGFCDYSVPLGFCFATGSGSFALVTSPVHSGRYAAAFSVRGDGNGGQTRCVQQGIFPAAAYYGAWYYVPEPAANSGNWNLFHFQGAVIGQALHGLWDLSLANVGDSGALGVTLFAFMPHPTSDAGAPPPIPIGQWFHIEAYLKRAKDATGEIRVWQDGALVASLANFATDDTDWGQWYVGNLATALLPPSSTVYVDDVTIAATGP